MGQMFSQASQRTQEQQQMSGDQTPYMYRLGARILGVIAGIICMVFGIWVMFSTSAGCIVGGILQMIFGFLIVALEAPFCCMWFEFIERIENFSVSRPFWQKAIIYGIMGLIPIIMCFGPTTVFTAGFIVLDAGVYGILALGKKADRETMMANAGGPVPPPGQPPTTGAPPAYDAWDSNVGKNAALP